MKAIEIRDLNFSYGKSYILKDVNLEFKTGMHTCILGRNGSGKSTFLRIMAGLLSPQSGSISILGNNAATLSFAERSKLVGFLTQQHKSIFPFLVEDVVLTGRAGYVKYIPQKDDKTAACEALQRVGIMHLSKRIYTELSGGEQQLVMIARVLAQQPKILLLDEPTTHLDLGNQSHLLSLLRKFVSEGITIISILHDPNLAFLFCDEFVFIHNNSIIPAASLTVPWDKEFLKTIYQGNIQTVPYNDRMLLIPSVEDTSFNLSISNQKNYALSPDNSSCL